MSKQATLTPSLIADMEAEAFILTCEESNVSVLKIIADLCDLGISQLNEIFYGVHKLILDKFEAREVQLTPNKDIDDLLQHITSLGAKLGELDAKKEIALFYYRRKTPSCFKKEEKE